MTTSTIDLTLPYKTRVNEALGNKHLKVALERGVAGEAIVRRLGNENPLAKPMVLVAGHGPFTWGKNASDSVLNAVFLEEIARIATTTVMLAPNAAPVEEYVSEYHYQRKHGKHAYYGQTKA